MRSATRPACRSVSSATSRAPSRCRSRTPSGKPRTTPSSSCARGKTSRARRARQVPSTSKEAPMVGPAARNVRLASPVVSLGVPRPPSCPARRCPPATLRSPEVSEYASPGTCRSRFPAVPAGVRRGCRHPAAAGQARAHRDRYHRGALALAHQELVAGGGSRSGSDRRMAAPAQRHRIFADFRRDSRCCSYLGRRRRCSSASPSSCWGSMRWRRSVCSRSRCPRAGTTSTSWSGCRRWAFATTWRSTA